MESNDSSTPACEVTSDVCGDCGAPLVDIHRHIPGNPAESRMNNMEPDLSIALKLIETGPLRYFSDNPDHAFDGAQLAEDVTSIVEAMWPLKTVSASEEDLQQAFEDATGDPEYDWLPEHQPNPDLVKVAKEFQRQAKAFEEQIKAATRYDKSHYGRPSTKSGAVLAEDLMVGDELEVVEKLSDFEIGETGTVTEVYRGAVSVDFGRLYPIFCSDGDFLDRVKLVGHTETPPPEACCGGDSKACQTEGPCRIERERRVKERKQIILITDGPVKPKESCRASLIVDLRGPSVIKARDAAPLGFEVKDLRHTRDVSEAAAALTMELADLLVELRDFTSVGDDCTYGKMINDAVAKVVASGVWGANG